MRPAALHQTRTYTPGVGHTIWLLIIIVALILVSCCGVAGAESVRPPIVVPSVSGPVVAPPGPTGVVHSDGRSVLSETPVNMSEINIESLSYVSSTVTVVSGPPAFLSGWSYRKIHAIGGSPDGDLTNYQMRFVVWRTTGTDSGENVYVGSSVKSDYGDLRFTTVAGAQMPYWIESVNATAAVVWVKVPSIPRAGTQVVMYYGNASAVSESDGSSVFSIFEDFEESVLSGWTLDSGVTVSQVTEGSNKVGRFTSNGLAGGGAYKSWTGGSGIIEYSIKPAQTTAYHTVSAFSGHASGLKGAWFFATNQGRFGSMAPSWAYYTSYNTNQWYSIRLDLKGNGYYDAYVNGVKVGSDRAYYSATTTDRLGLVGWTTGGQASYDNIRVRKFTNTGPVHGGWLSEVTNEQLVADFSFNPTSGQYPLNVTFTDLSTGPITSRSWDFGDG
ncbi:DUF2341 domain-containing protein, partial [Methanospirillum hungatei]|uniref:DUF2341 domain-containing protein n=1 Tax=Methanospirillum hungatei TaxID=2203 RepID=UPI0026E961B7